MCMVSPWTFALTLSRAIRGVGERPNYRTEWTYETRGFVAAVLWPELRVGGWRTGAGGGRRAFPVLALAVSGTFVLSKLWY